MKKVKPIENNDLRPEYRREDLGKGVRDKYFRAYQKGTNLVLLSPDVAKAFPTSGSHATQDRRAYRSATPDTPTQLPTHSETKIAKHTQTSVLSPPPLGPLFGISANL